jgi:hypothetical protein
MTAKVESAAGIDMRGRSMPAPLNWQKSSFSGGGEGNACLELATSAQALHLRESDYPTVLLTTTPAGHGSLCDRRWRRSCRAVRARMSGVRVRHSLPPRDARQPCTGSIASSSESRLASRVRRWIALDRR